MIESVPGLSWDDGGEQIDFAWLDHQFAETARVAAGRAGKSTIVETSPLAYRAGMTTEVRIAPKWGTPVSDFLRYLRAIDQSPKTIYLRSYQLRVMSQAFRGRSPWTLTRADIESYLASLRVERSAKRSVLSCIRKFYRYGCEENLCLENPARYIQSIERVEGVPRPAPDHAIRLALDAAEPRVKMMIMLGAYCGLRRSEIAKVHTDDLRYLPDGAFGLHVVGKRKKIRVVRLTPFMASMIRESEPGYLFPSWHRGQVGADGRIHDRPLSSGRVGELMHDVLSPHGVTPHMLRHRYATTFYRATHDIRATQKTLGHESLTTTQVYVDIPDESFAIGAAAAGVLA